MQGKRYGSGSVDEQVMGRLGEVIQGMKDDFIVVHLQEPCSLCREYISDAPRYTTQVMSQCLPCMCSNDSMEHFLLGW